MNESDARGKLIVVVSPILGLELLNVGVVARGMVFNDALPETLTLPTYAPFHVISKLWDAEIVNCLVPSALWYTVTPCEPNFLDWYPFNVDVLENDLLFPLMLIAHADDVPSYTLAHDCNESIYKSAHTVE